MKISVRFLIQHGLEFLFPSRCVGCGRDGTLLCDTCLDASTRLSGEACRRCATPMRSGSLCSACAASPPALTRLTAAFKFDDAIRKAVHEMKYQGVRSLAPVLAEQMAADPRVQRAEADALVPVPLHRKRMRRRGYNQAELLARELGRRIAIPMETHLVERTVDTDAQVHVKDERARAANVAGAFAARMPTNGRRLMLVDDVTTTGSTLNACARALLEAGAKRVDAIVLAKEV